MDAFLDELARELGQVVGTVAGKVFAALFYLLIAFLVFGLPVDRIISKAGYDGKIHLVIFLGMFQAVIFPPLSILLFGQYSSITEFVMGGSGFTLLITFYMIAYAPWPIWDELRQLRRKLGLNPEDGKPPKVKQ